MKPSHDHTRESDRHDRRYMYIPSFALPMYKTTCHAKPYLCCRCFCTTYCWLVLFGVFFLFLPTLLRKLHGDGCCCTEPSETFRVRPRYDYEKKHVSRDSKMCCCCCRFCFGCSDDRRKNTRTGALMIHRRLTTAGYEVAPHYHQLLVR